MLPLLARLPSATASFTGSVRHGLLLGEFILRRWHQHILRRDGIRLNRAARTASLSSNMQQTNHRSRECNRKSLIIKTKNQYKQENGNRIVDAQDHFWRKQQSNVDVVEQVSTGWDRNTCTINIAEAQATLNISNSGSSSIK